MLTRWFLAVVLAAFALTSATANVFALSDAEYKVLKKSSPEYRQAEADLALVWKKAMHKLKSQEGMGWRELRDNQRDWIDGKRDVEAKACMQNGMSKAEAYVKVTRDRISFLQKFATDHVGF